MENNNAIGYRRLSERDQSRYSLNYQEKAIKDYVQRFNLNLLSIYTDNGQGSDTFDRPDYRALEDFIKRHKGKARYLIVMDHDRFSRNLPEALMKIDELEDKYRIKVLATNEDIHLDTKDPAVFMQRAFNYLMANQELLRIRKRTRDGMRQARLDGRYVNKAPFGYINSKDELGKPILKIDDDKAAVVRMIFREYLSGTPMFLIHRKAKKAGFYHTGNSAIPKVLTNCVYAGLVKVSADRNTPEKLVKALHQPIVKETHYWLAQEKLGNKRRSKSQPKAEFPLRGILKCWCGKPMTAGFSKGKNNYYLYYRCTKHVEKNYRGDILHQQFEDLLETLSFTKKQVEVIDNRARKLLETQTLDTNKVLIARKKQLVDIEQKVDKLEGRLMNDEIDAVTYKKWLDKYRQEKAVIVDEIESLNDNSRSDKFEKLNHLLPKLSNLKDIYKMAKLEDKHSLIKGVFKLSLSYSEGKFRTPYILPAFVSNSLKAKEKGLLDFEEPLALVDKIPLCSP